MTDLGGRPWPAEANQILAASGRTGSGRGEVMMTRYGTGEQVRLEYWAV
jgi:hypothetical protein